MLLLYNFCFDSESNLFERSLLFFNVKLQRVQSWSSSSTKITSYLSLTIEMNKMYYSSFLEVRVEISKDVVFVERELDLDARYIAKERALNGS